MGGDPGLQREKGTGYLLKLSNIRWRETGKISWGGGGTKLVTKRRSNNEKGLSKELNNSGETV